MRHLLLALSLGLLACGDDDGTLIPDAGSDGSVDASDPDATFDANDFDANDFDANDFDGGCSDRDDDGVCDDVDGCPDDGDKTEAGECGCGMPDVDTDSDGTLDCNDACPDDPSKVDPGICGCGMPDETDGDGDGTRDCEDECPADPGKIVEGVCGCGMADVDTDGDGPLDCLDGCPMDPNKVDPGVCGCGVLDLDSDGDLTLDCDDPCPMDPDKTDPLVCGCGNSELDADSNGTPDCVEGCADGEREGFTQGAHPRIAACAGGFSVGGVLTVMGPTCARAAGDDSGDPSGTGCNVTDICQAGWHVCTGPADVASHSTTGCVGLVGPLDDSAFYLSRASGNGGSMCEATGANDAFGCGNVGATPNPISCAPLDRFTQDLCANVPRPPWNCGAVNVQEANNITHDGSGPGGVLCCVD